MNRRPLSRKSILIMSLISGLIIVAVAVWFLMGGADKAGQDNTSLYHKRAGYEQAGAGIGDASALVSKYTNVVVEYGGAKVIQPCTVLALKDVRDAGLKLKANQLPGAVSRVFFDGQGSAPLPAASDFSLPFTDDSNMCQYYLEDEGEVTLTVYQPSYASEQAVNRQISRNFNPIADVGGLKAYVEQPGKSGDNTSVYMLKGNGVSAQLRLTTPDTAAKSRLLDLTAQHLAQAAMTPTSLENFTYSSPIFDSAVVAPCSLSDPASFKAILGVDQGPLTQETLSSAIGVIEYQGTGRYNFVTRTCKHRSADASTRDKTLTIEATTYETTEGAVAATAFEKSGESLAKNIQAITPVIGDESYFADSAGMSNAMTIRKGRVIVRLSFYVPQLDDSITPELRIQAMTPLAKKIASGMQ